MLWPAAQEAAVIPAGAASGLCPDLPVRRRIRIRPSVAGYLRLRAPPGTLHAGVDIAGRRGSPLYAAAAGTVVSAACTSAYCDRDGSLGLIGYGNLVELDHGGGVTTRYGHTLRLHGRGGPARQRGDSGRLSGIHRQQHRCPPALRGPPGRRAGRPGAVAGRSRRRPQRAQPGRDLLAPIPATGGAMHRTTDGRRR